MESPHHEEQKHKSTKNVRANIQEGLFIKQEEIGTGHLFYQVELKHKKC